MNPARFYIRFFYLCLGSLTLFLLGGCAATSLDVSLNYPLAAIEKKAVPVTIGVDTFIDQRPQAMGNDGKTWMGLIPGMFWLEIDTDLPEIYTAYSAFRSKPLNQTVSRAVHHAIEQSGLAEKTIYLPADPYAEIDYRLEGTLLKSQIKETGYYYGSAMYVWLPRVFGFPYVSYELALEVELKLRHMASNEIVWSGIIKGQRSDKYLNVYKIANGREGKHVIAYHFTDILSQKLEGFSLQIHDVLSRQAVQRKNK